ncbi:hypothetical protein BH20VER3_BH20VER3_04270 [soil metagenome]
MIDLNHILLFLAVVSPLILLVRIARMRDPRNQGWGIAALIVLAGCGLAWLAAPTVAGFIGGVFWFLLLVLPSLAERKIAAWVLVQRPSEARRLALVRRTLHPWEDSPYRPSLLRSLEQAKAGRLDLALDQLAAERAAATPAGRFATALTFALTENWLGLVQWCQRDLAVTNNPALLSLYCRALGEVGAQSEQVLLLTAQAEARETRLTTDLSQVFNLVLGAAFAGQKNELVRLLEGDMRRLPAEQQQFWLATAEMQEGDTGPARERLQRLRVATQDAVLRRSIDRRLAHPPAAATLSPGATRQLARLLGGSSGAPHHPPGRTPATGAPAVWALILFNVAMFGVEMIMGGSTNPLTLQNLGGLEPAAVIVRHEYWRLLTALFLHYGALHLSVNLLGLYILGPSLERLLGATKFLLSYLVSGLGSSAGVVVLWSLGLNQSDLLVGASGSIMGVIGVSAGLLVRHRQSPLAGRQLKNFIAIVAIQTAFDLWRPEVSLSAHLSGFVSGLLLGLLFASSSRAAGQS